MLTREAWWAEVEAAFPQLSLYGTVPQVGDMPAVVVEAPEWPSLALQLRDHPATSFEQLTDLCVVDYLHFGQTEWSTHSATSHGFSRARYTPSDDNPHWSCPRFAVVVHLLSFKHNQRLRVHVPLAEEGLRVGSVTKVWPAANWFEREAFDLFGVLFDGHPDLRRILTDYGFTGHPFRKDFPVSGHVEMRYDAASERCVYEPVDLQPRVTVPKIVRDDPPVAREGLASQEVS